MPAAVTRAQPPRESQAAEKPGSASTARAPVEAPARQTHALDVTTERTRSTTATARARHSSTPTQTRETAAPHESGAAAASQAEGRQSATRAANPLATAATVCVEQAAPDPRNVSAAADTHPATQGNAAGQDITHQPHATSGGLAGVGRVYVGQRTTAAPARSGHGVSVSVTGRQNAVSVANVRPVTRLLSGKSRTAKRLGAQSSASAAPEDMAQPSLSEAAATERQPALETARSSPPILHATATPLKCTHGGGGRLTVHVWNFDSSPAKGFTATVTLPEGVAFMPAQSQLENAPEINKNNQMCSITDTNPLAPGAHRAFTFETTPVLDQSVQYKDIQVTSAPLAY